MKKMSLRNIRGGFLRDEYGSIAMEFVIVMPFVLFLVTNGLAYWDAFQSNSKTAKIAYTISDIVSRYEVVNNTDMADLAGVLDKLLEPALDHRLLRISSICFENGTHKVLWSYTGHSSDIIGPGPLQDADIPVEILPTMAPQDSIILTEVEARWQPRLHVGVGSRTWRSELVTKPRFVKVIPHTTLNPSNICPGGA